jgi:hypothetical protein
MNIREKIQWNGTKKHGFVDMGTNIDPENDQLDKTKNALILRL